MPRLVRHVVPASLPVLLAIALVAIGPGISAGASITAAEPLAAVDWPPSSGLLVGEVMTGGASASDEFVELYNGGATSLDLAGQEVVYVTSTGGTVTRKATWATTTMLDPGRHILLANASGLFAAIADATYSGGLAATGGTILVRPVGGAVIDAIGWGDASNAFVEGTVAPAPATGSSLERRPGGTAGNRSDSNQNLADWLLNDAPVAQNLASPAVPGGSIPTPTPTTGPTPTPFPTQSPTPVPTQTASPQPTSSPTPVATPTVEPTPTPSPAPTSTTAPTPTPTALPTPSPTVARTQGPTQSPVPSPTPTPLPTPSPIPTPSPSPVPSVSPPPSVSPSPGIIDIAVARTGAAGSRVRVRGIVTVEPGRIVDGRTFAIQDGRAGILVRLDGARKDLAVARGTDVIVEGRLGTRYGALELRLEDGDPLEAVTAGTLPAAQAIELAALSEATEARLVSASGVVLDMDTAKSGTTTIIVEDASGRGRVVAFVGAGTIPDTVRRDVTLSVVGIAGQRSTATGRLDGYRIWVRDGADLQVTASPSPSPSGAALPSGSPSTSPNQVSIAIARAHAGQKVVVEGIVTSPAGLLDADDRRVTIEDGTGAILLRLLAHESAPAVGSRVRATGSTGTYYGAPQLSATAALAVIGRATPTANALSKAPGAGSEWELVRVRGTVVDVRRYGQAWRAELRLTDGTKVPIVGLARASITVELIKEGQTGSIVGIIRRAYPSASDRRFAILPRTRSDLDLGAAPAVAGQTAGETKPTTAAGSPTAAAPSPSGPPSVNGSVTVEAADVPAHAGRLVRVGGLVTRAAAPIGQDADVTVLIEDDSGTVTLRFSAAAATVGASLRAGDLVEASGTVEVNDAGWAVVVDDAADVVTAGQVVGPGSQPSAPPGDRPDPTAGDQAASTEGADGGDDTTDGAASVAPLMGAAGAGGLVAAILAAAAAGGRWRRRQERHRGSKEATRRLLELLSAPHEASPSEGGSLGTNRPT